jgi:hypothetical protein
MSNSNRDGSDSMAVVTRLFSAGLIVPFAYFLHDAGTKPKGQTCECDQTIKIPTPCTKGQDQ